MITWRTVGGHLVTYMTLTISLANDGVFLGEAAFVILWGLAPPAVAALVEGTALAERDRRIPSGIESWQFSVIATPVSIALGTSVAWLAVAVAPAGASVLARLAAPVATGVPEAWVAAAVLAVLLVNRGLFALGARWKVRDLARGRLR